jgi:hypothetical protein
MARKVDADDDDDDDGPQRGKKEEREVEKLGTAKRPIAAGALNPPSE